MPSANASLANGTISPPMMSNSFVPFVSRPVRGNGPRPIARHTCVPEDPSVRPPSTCTRPTSSKVFLSTPPAIAAPSAATDTTTASNARGMYAPFAAYMPPDTLPFNAASTSARPAVGPAPVIPPTNASTAPTHPLRRTWRDGELNTSGLNHRTRHHETSLDRNTENESEELTSGTEEEITEGEDEYDLEVDELDEEEVDNNEEIVVLEDEDSIDLEKQVERDADQIYSMHKAKNKCAPSKCSKVHVQPVVFTSLCFRVPFDGATSSITIASSTTWIEFLNEMANMMLLAPKTIWVAYRFNADLCSAPHTHLASAQDLGELWKCAVIAKQKQKNQDDDFFVELKNLNEGEKGKKGGKGGAGEKKDKDRKQSKKKKRQVSDSDGSASDSADGDTHNKAMSLTQWVAKINSDNKCEKHTGHSCIHKGSGECYKLTRQDVGTWAVFCSHGHESTTVPPHSLKLGNIETPSKPSKKLADDPSTPNPRQPGYVSVPPYMPVLGLPYTPYTAPGAFLGYGPGLPARHERSPVPYFPSSAHCENDHYIFNAPSSDPPDEMEDDTWFPLINDWLKKLDSGPKGVDSHMFIQFAKYFEDKKYYRISDIADSTFTPETLAAACTGIAHRTATKLLKSMQDETKHIRKQQA
ncbi:hypothetical protein BDQ17DRAFT_1427259 [Cyathus striatus]|nr:hypothetical protein BDQ17DRAFT_1427259 [Cyathus striatus]